MFFAFETKKLRPQHQIPGEVKRTLGLLIEKTLNILFPNLTEIGFFQFDCAIGINDLDGNIILKTEGGPKRVVAGHHRLERFSKRPLIELAF